MGINKNLNLQFNKAIIKRVRAEGLSSKHVSNLMLILFALHENRVDLLDELDDENKDKTMLILYRHLVRKGFLSENLSKEASNRFSPTQKALVLIDFVKGEYSEGPVDTETMAITVATSSVDTWIDEYINLFPTPKDAHNPLEKQLRSNKKDVIIKMEWFIKNYSHSKETILRATKMYLEAHKTQRYEFTRTASYFIVKGTGYERISDLATACDNVVNAPNDTTFDTSIFDTV